jgi:hypothetical protein
VRPARLILLTLVVAALAVFILLVERHAPTTQQRRERADRVWPGFQADAARRIVVAGPAGTFELTREDGGADWLLAAPIRDRADEGAVAALLSTLEGLRSERALPAADLDLTDYGLADPAHVVAVTEASGRERRLAVGNPLPLGNTRAVSAAGEYVYLVSAYLTSDLDRDLEGWRSKQLADLVASDLVSVSIAGDGDRVELVRVAETWRLSDPLSDLADRDRVTGLIADLGAARVREFVDDPGELDAYGLALPRFTVVATTNDGERLELAFGARRDAAGSAQVALRRGEGVVWVDAAAAERLTIDPGMWRSPRLVGFDSWAADALIIEAGGTRIELERADGLWKANGTEVGYGAVARRLSMLTDLKVLEFRDDRPVGEELGRLQATIDDGRRVTVAFFAGVSAGESLAVVDDRPGSMAVDAARAAEVLADPAALAAPAPADEAPS